MILKILSKVKYIWILKKFQEKNGNAFPSWFLKTCENLVYKDDHSIQSSD